ncbi:MAG: hypothetical protein HYW16_04360 [Candidatus Rokubacteria bacterium]|nr:hypothetical protein [Candidatus Rokubacteria bacterium]
MRRRMLEMQKQIEDLLAYVRREAVSGDHRTRGAQEALVRAASGQLKPLDLF